MMFQFQLCTPDKIFFKGEASSLVVPGLDGYFGVLARHARMVSAVGLGTVKIVSGEKTLLFVVDGGVAEVTPEESVILADRVIPATDTADAEEKIEEIKAMRLPAVILR